MAKARNSLQDREIQLALSGTQNVTSRLTPTTYSVSNIHYALCPNTLAAVLQALAVFPLADLRGGYTALCLHAVFLDSVLNSILRQIVTSISLADLTSSHLPLFNVLKFTITLPSITITSPAVPGNLSFLFGVLTCLNRLS